MDILLLILDTAARPAWSRPLLVAMIAACAACAWAIARHDARAQDQAERDTRPGAASITPRPPKGT